MHFLDWDGNSWLPPPWNVPLAPDVPLTILKNIFQTSTNEPIIELIEILTEYSVKIVLREVKGSFLSLLGRMGAYMVSPESTPMHSYIDTNTGDLVGTGPFVYDGYEVDQELNFTAYEDYWDGKTDVEKMIFKIFIDQTELNNALLEGKIHFLDNTLDSMIHTFRTHPNINLIEEENTRKTFMGFNGYMVWSPFRKAISYAIDYSYLIDEILLGKGYRLKSPIPRGIPMSNYGFNYPVFDRAYAQSRMQSLGYGVGFTTDAEWLAVADSGGWGFGWNITAQTEGTTRRDFALSISDNLRYLGIDAPVVQISFWEIITCMQHDVGPLRRDMIPMYFLGWAPDYIDPENYISPLYSSRSSLWVNTYDEELEQLMLDGETTFDIVARQAIYNEIQRKLVEELYFFAWIATGKNYDAYSNDFIGFQPNPMDRVWFYPIYYVGDITPPIVIYDTIPDEIKITYTRSAQIIGTIKAYDLSNILYVGWFPTDNPDPGFSLITTYNEGEMGGNILYFSETVVMTTTLLEPGIHSLNLIIVDGQGNIYEKSFTVEVYRQAELKLSGEFDYLEKEKVKISIAAQVLDLEEKFLMIPTSGGIDFTVHIRIVDYNGVTKVEDSMSYDSNGFFHWDSIFTINDLKDLFPKGIYIVQGWVEFSDNSYYEGGNDVIQFHIDPPGSIESNSWSILEIFSFGGLITVGLALAFLFLRERRRRIRLE